MTAGKVAVYTRVTSQNQLKAGYSLDLQREELRKYAEENNLEIIKEFSDVASAYETDREGFNEMLEYLDGSKDCKTILVTKIDKLCRNTETYGELENYSVISIAEGSDKRIHQFSIAMAENYSKHMSERIKTDLSCIIDTFDSDRERFEMQDGSDYQIDTRGFISCDDYREGNVHLTVNITESSAFLLELNAKKYRLTTSAFLDELITCSTLHIDEDYGKFCAIVGELKFTRINR